ISIGMMVGMILGAAIAVRWGWRSALGVVALPGLIVTILIYFTREYKTVPLEQTTASDQKVKIKKSQIIGGFFRKPSLIAAYIAFAAQSFVYVSIITFAPTFYVRIMGVSLQKAATLSSAALPIMIFAGAIGGWAVDRWMLSNLRARLYFPTIMYLLAALFNVIAFGLFSGVSVTYVFVFASLGSIMLTAAGPACMAITQEVVHPGVRAMSYGVGLVFQHLLGSAPGPLVTGALSDKFGLPTALTCAGGVSLIAAIVLFIGSYAYVKDRDSVEKVTIKAEE
ncbi:MAG TPA: MFS transporter, partial [Thermodesulfobacteriota bacterium]|nr:MFS transporter [Thermodesulfobacteriota bacterium]